MNIFAEFTGGLELLLDGTKKATIQLPENSKITALFTHIHDNLLTHSKDLFLKDGKLRPGILVLINDSDWELEGSEEYILKDNDAIVLISTLHGG